MKNQKIEKKLDSTAIKSPVALREEAILKFWEENKIFEKSLEKRQNAPFYSFYDGPPFATGTPHYGHIVASAMKDVAPRYWAMRGYYVERKWGWDCHGLPIENIAEKELGITHKKEILKMGVEKFNEFCRSKVLKYAEEWKTVIKRLGRWADMENSYKTMDLNFMESVWRVFKELWDKGFIYEGYRVMHICTRCETTLSQSEVAEGYKTIKDLSVMVRFKLVPGQKIGDFMTDDNTYILAWTTTPWTLIGNVALAINKGIKYAMVKTEKDFCILAKDRIGTVLENKKHEILNEFKGKDLVGLEYNPPFDYYLRKGLQNEENGWKVYNGDFVATNEGTGIVHIAPAFGEDDMKLGQKHKLPFVQHVGMDGIVKKEAGEFAGLSVKPAGDRQKTDIEIIKYLARNNSLFTKEKYEHSYPHCWRCDTPLINYATSSWFVNVLKIKPRALELAKKINWSPSHIKEGRFGKWLEGARDWSISRQRFWASAIPIWRCGGFAETKNPLPVGRQGKPNIKNENSKICDNIKVFGSVAELEKISGQKVADLHKHIVDKITFKCAKCGGEMRRVPDVLDTWFDSGSMPYAQMHYPFENKEKFNKGFPANFIAEGVDQTRAWFYYLHLIAVAIKDGPAYKNVIVNGIVLAEDGKKMSKRLKNYPDPTLMFDKYGADALRFYLLSSPVVSAETINFKESDVAELNRGMFRMLWNSYLFFQTYASKKEKISLSPSLQKRETQKSLPLQRELGEFSASSQNLLDKWIISELNILTKHVNEGMEKYELVKTVRAFPKFIDNFSNWHIRRSRERFAKPENDPDRISAEETMYNVLVALSKLLAPFAPFISEEIYKNITGEESVHFADYPKADEKLIDDELSEQMAQVRQSVTSGLAARASVKIKVRQPLSTIIIPDKLQNELRDLVKDELNVKKVITFNEKMAPQFTEEDGHFIIKMDDIELDTKITDKLKEEGVVRDIARHIQTMRKDLGLTKENTIEIYYESDAVLDGLIKKWGDYIKTKTIAEKISHRGEGGKYDVEKDLDIESKKIIMSIKVIK